MWICPECHRQFKKLNQNHYCSKKPESIEEYLMMQEDTKREILNRIYQLLCQTLPDVERKIAWGMPTFYKNGNIIHFAAAKNHLGLYPGDEAVAHFDSKLQGYVTSKGSIHIPYDSVDESLIVEIAIWCYKNHNND